MKVAIMQPCYLPWRGYFALMKCSDVFVHLVDVPLPQGRSYQTRIALKTTDGTQWLSLPVRRSSGQLIEDTQLNDNAWRRVHRATLQQEYPAAFKCIADLFERDWTSLADLNITIAERLAETLNIQCSTHRSTAFTTSRCAHATGSGKILELCRNLNATTYLTGHGARNYLDHESFDRNGIEVCYLDYDLTPYPQPYGPFTPYVTVLDVLEYADTPGRFIDAALVPWRTFIAHTPERGTTDG